ncbi:MAG: hypothetical protein ABWZ26_07840, partial [Candidatus Nanopelagicales bacterium]
MQTAPQNMPTLVALTTAGVTLIVDSSAGRMPAVIHWGRAIPELDEDAAVALLTASQPLAGPNDV